jgi:hypothetical protein
MNDTATLPELVLCVPGPWADRKEFLERVVEGTQGKYMFAGRLLMHVETQTVFEVDFQPRDARMARAFQAAGPHWRDSAAMLDIEGHRSVAYLLGHGGSDRNVQALMLAAQALLDAGGLGVKVESSGLAHAPEAWRESCLQFALFSPYHAFVVAVTGPGEAYSCGMHTFALRDVQVIDDDPASALRTARLFSWYLFTEQPDIRDGQTFSCDAQSPRYRIAAGAGVKYEPGSLFTNPYGAWRLEPLRQRG